MFVAVVMPLLASSPTHANKVSRIASSGPLDKLAIMCLVGSSKCEEKSVDNIEQNALPVSVTPGIGCFITHDNKRTPHVFENFIQLMHSIPQVIIFLKIQYARIPVVSIQQRLLVKLYGESVYHITARFGYSENDKNLYDDVLILARNLYQIPISDDEMKVTFFISNQTVNVSTKGWKSWIRRWPLYLYSVLKALYPSEAINIQLPLENTVYIGTLSEL
ncbi:unnamed protein product [Didymodactylos carnosus]|uniref:K+ potassium transporter C-terminal domain-containing protein n=1 Tax=Didymodactylos carnosus TaxID=1234261 RepID=A0A8S2KQ03_9BILA|nr:unnamed protein product [Didymodactylos carnosus]CAF3863582.1 unnamed protein product [Didymodactylos carnosus]